MIETSYTISLICFIIFGIFFVISLILWFSKDVYNAILIVSGVAQKKEMQTYGLEASKDLTKMEKRSKPTKKKSNSKRELPTHIPDEDLALVKKSTDENLMIEEKIEHLNQNIEDTGYIDISTDDLGNAPDEVISDTGDVAETDMIDTSYNVGEDTSLIEVDNDISRDASIHIDTETYPNVPAPLDLSDEDGTTILEDGTAYLQLDDEFIANSDIII